MLHVGRNTGRRGGTAWRGRRYRLRSRRRRNWPTRSSRRLSLCSRRHNVRCALCSGRGCRHLSGRRCDGTGWSGRWLALRGGRCAVRNSLRGRRRRDWPTRSRRRLSLYGRRHNVRCALCSGWDWRPHGYLNGGRRRNWMACCRWGNTLRRFCSRGRRRGFRGRWCRSDGWRFCWSGRLLRRNGFRLLLGLCRLGEHDQRLACDRRPFVIGSTADNAGGGHLNRHDGKNRAGHK